ncbi:DUF4386 domain-containing protein [Chondrinema litorale]|uniref:DUF4386 domain-containing protein n=1 Tax=Chondrinema litorale TaxID=2994555 RepID=UPI002542D231|nr:DUF4386 domain-containing protein [Chondrinema litorale]UZR96900.1 DUF4386 domain-containing protein [Chondrinema litorale]
MMESKQSRLNLNIGLIVGLSLIIMAIAAFFALESLNTFEANLQDNALKLDTTSLKKSILAWLVILITDILVAWGLYVIYKPINNQFSLLAAWFRLIYVVFLSVGIASLIFALQAANLFLEDFTKDNIEISILLFKEIWSFGLIIFGCHLLLLGYLSIKSVLIPKLISILLIIAGVGYLIIHSGSFLIEDFTQIVSTLEMVFMLPMVLSEMSLAVWLIMKQKTVSQQLITV